MSSIPGYVWSEEEINGTRMGRYLTRAEWSFIQHAFKKLGTPQSILDIGGGDGRMAWRMKSLGVRVTLIEFDWAPLLRLGDNHNADFFLQGDGLLLPFEKDSFDSVIAIQLGVCTSVENIDRFFAEVARVLKPGGSFLFSLMNGSSPLRHVFPEYGQRHKFYGMGYRYYSTTFIQAQKVLSRYGFSEQFRRGYRWAPFGRASQNPMIAVIELLEKYSGIRYLPRLSPWVFWAACRKD